MKHKVAKYTETQFNYNLGSLLLEYLHHYGVAFNYFTTGIQIAGEGKFFPKHMWSEISGEVVTNANQNRFIIILAIDWVQYLTLDCNYLDQESYACKTPMWRTMTWARVRT